MNEPDPFGPPPDLELFDAPPAAEPVVWAHVEPDASPETLRALGEVASKAIDQIRAGWRPPAWDAPTSRRTTPPEITEIELERKCRNCGSTAGYNDSRGGRPFCAKCGRVL